jgi:glycosyltransferase involved in cell wall biosynthesis
MSVDRTLCEQPAVLVINPDLPRYGVKFHEFINTTALAETCSVGLVTQTGGLADWAHIRRLETRGVAVYAADSSAGAWANGTARAAGRGPHRRMRGWLRDAHSFVALFRPRPAEVYDNRRTLANLAGPLRRALAERPWDEIVIIQSRYAEWLDWLPKHLPTLIVLHDIQTMVWRRRFSVTALPWDKFKAFVTAAKFWAYEHRYLHRFTGIVCLTDVDAQIVRRWFGIDWTTVVPLPVDGDYYRALPRSNSAEKVALFPGMLNHRPNADAALWLARSILPRVRRTLPDARLVIAGAHPPPEILALDGREGISVTGEVPDMRPLFQAASVVVVPLRFGSGARNKILEAWACGRPVLSTPVGAEGLAAIDGVNVRLAGNAVAFADVLVELLDQPDRATALIEAGAASVKAHEARRVGAQYRSAVVGSMRTASAVRRGPMRICLDMRWMVPGSAGGLEQQGRAFVEQLLAIDRVNFYTLILPIECCADFGPRGYGNWRIVHCNAPSADFRRIGRALGRRLGRALGGSAANWPDRWALSDLHALDCDIAYSFTGFINPELWELRHVVAVPDIQHEFMPEFFSPAALSERRRLFDQSLVRAEHICAMSDHTRRNLIERLGIEASRVSVTHLAADAIFGPAEPASAQAAKARLEHRYGLKTGQYFFLPAHTWSHKNHAVAIRALAGLRERYGLNVMLACSGAAREAQAELERLVVELSMEKQVRFLGYVPRYDVPALYHGAAALVFPSRFEGFGMPVLEAMACGTPVICADTTSLPEVAGDAALCLPPLSVERWTEAMHRVLSDVALRASLIARGIERARLFSWRRHALETLAVFASLRDRRLKVAPDVGVGTGGERQRVGLSG